MNIPLILDGAMGTELIRRGLDLPLPLWSADINLTHPESVQQVHDAYITAGSDVITTNTFRTTPWTYRKAGYTPLRALERARDSLLKAVELANKAAMDTVRVAGSITAVEDCYTPELYPGKTAVEDTYGTALEWFLESDIDLVLFETMGNMEEIKIAMELSSNLMRERWLSLILRDKSHLLDGTRLEFVLDTLREQNISVLLFNCNKIETTLDALHNFDEKWSGTWGAYPNLGITDFENHYFKILDNSKFEASIKEILHQNPDVIGVCCGSIPRHIELIKSYIMEGENASENQTVL